MISTGTRRILRIDSSQVATDSSDQNSLKLKLASGRLSSDINGVTAGWARKLAELIMYNKELNTYELNQIEDYLTTKYRI